jgi:50S ribosomal protein L16 3-hydroxylase
MISYATDQGGVGPHYDSYDVFLLQAQGRRRWRIGRQKDLSLQPDVPLKILANFEPEEEHLLEPGDMLYLPPRYAHDGIAEGECMTYSVGFRVPSRAELARELLQRLAEDMEESLGASLYRDPDQAAVAQPAEIPPKMLEFAQDALRDALKDSQAFARGLGEYMTEPKPSVWFDTVEPADGLAQALRLQGCRLDRRTRMMFDVKHIFINGESFTASGRDAALMHILANERLLSAKEVGQLSAQAFELLVSWAEAGWLMLV